MKLAHQLLLSLAVVALSAGCSRDEARPETVPSASPAPVPSSPEIGPELRTQLEAVLAGKGPKYVPRTRHKSPAGKPKYTNRLIRESSPYLLQHAHNPVNWFPWGDEAFAIAKATGRPVFLSVGYSTCHWCHVMEEESFEDEAIAAYMNEHYVAIKLDREERPDVDSIYMASIHLMHGRGGWPMSVWLNPAREPFFGGTYFPPRDGARGRGKGFFTILKEQKARFEKKPGEVAAEAKRIAAKVKEHKTKEETGGLVSIAQVGAAVRHASSRFDSTWGGQRGQPKFPSSFPVRLLLREHSRRADSQKLKMVTTTLSKMHAGGMYDHVGGGFHRYSTDQRWLVPHFEKMLYDNALLVVAYLEGYQATQSPEFVTVVRETLDYVAREMTAPSGGFYSATDADSLTPSGHREEGWFFTWTPAELVKLVPEALQVPFNKRFGVTAAGNFERRNILHFAQPLEQVAKAQSQSPEELDQAFVAVRKKLLAARATRPPPLLDDKIQVSWNGLMLSAFARAAFVLQEPRYTQIAVKNAGVLLDKLRVNGKLRHSLSAGLVSPGVFLEDHAFFAAGLLDLFELTGDTRWLRESIALMNELETLYADTTYGGYFLTPHQSEQLLAREKPDYDGAVPSGNSIALMTLARLHVLTTDDKWRVRSEMASRAFANTLGTRPYALETMLLAVDFAQGSPKEVVIVSPAEGDEGTAELTAVLRQQFHPRRVALIGSAQKLAGMQKDVPWLAGKVARAGRATAYVCELGNCELPTGDPLVLARQLSGLSARPAP